MLLFIYLFIYLFFGAALNAIITLQTEKVEWQNKLKELQNCRREMEVNA